jgi:hypothetical protein
MKKSQAKRNILRFLSLIIRIVAAAAAAGDFFH